MTDPPVGFADAMDESDDPAQDASSPPSLPPPSGQVGARYEECSLCAKAKVSRRTTGVRQSSPEASVWQTHPAAGCCKQTKSSSKCFPCGALSVVFFPYSCIQFFDIQC